MPDAPFIPPMTEIDGSSNVAAIGHDPDANALHVRFRNGGHYAFDGAGPEIHEAMLNAESAGRHFYANVRGKFPSRKIG